jgi:hypothetical protein
LGVFLAVTFIKTILRTKPHKSLMVLQDATHRALRESLIQPEPLKFDPARGILGEEKGVRV